MKSTNCRLGSSFIDIEKTHSNNALCDGLKTELKSEQTHFQLNVASVKSSLFIYLLQTVCKFVRDVTETTNASSWLNSSIREDSQEQ